MFRILWEPAAFGRMQGLIRDNPGLKAGFAYTLRTLTIELSREADAWGESRGGDYRLGFVGVLSVLARVDVANRVARVVDVDLLPQFRTG